MRAKAVDVVKEAEAETLVLASRSLQVCVCVWFASGPSIASIQAVSVSVSVSKTLSGHWQDNKRHLLPLLLPVHSRPFATPPARLDGHAHAAIANLTRNSSQTF